MNQLISALNWRYATKQFDTDKKLSPEQLDTLIEAVRLTPTSYGLQLFKLIVVTDPELKQKIQSAAFNQSQITTCSHLFIFISKTSFTSDDIENHLNLIKSVRDLSPESQHGFAQMLQTQVASRSSDDINLWNQKQTYIALGFLLSACALEKIDSCPMEGFNPEAVSKILSLKDYTTTLICPVGFRSENDESQKKSKVRQSTSELLQLPA